MRELFAECLQLSTSADTSNVHQGEAVPVTVSVSNVYLVDPNTQPPPDHADDAGQLEFFIDDDSGSPILITAQTSVSVTVPQDEPEGSHKLICQVHKHDGTATNVSISIDIKVVAATK